MENWDTVTVCIAELAALQGSPQWGYRDIGRPTYLSLNTNACPVITALRSIPCGDKSWQLTQVSGILNALLHVDWEQPLTTKKHSPHYSDFWSHLTCSFICSLSLGKCTFISLYVLVSGKLYLKFHGGIQTSFKWAQVSKWSWAMQRSPSAQHTMQATY